MKRQLLATFVLAGISALLVAQSPPPPPTPTIQAQNKQSLSAGIQNDSATSPPPIIGPAQHDVATEKENKENGQRSTNQRIDFLAWVVAIAGVAQFVAAMIQAYFMRRALDSANKSADAANESAEAANKAITQAKETTLITQRAVILLESVEAQPPSPVYLERSSVLVFTLKNFGATVAYDVKLKGVVIFRPGPGMDISGAQGITMAPQGSNKWITISLSNRVNDEQLNKILMGAHWLTYQLEVTYADAFGKTHAYKAEGQYIAILGAFITGSSTSD